MHYSGDTAALDPGRCKITVWDTVDEGYSGSQEPKLPRRLGRDLTIVTFQFSYNSSVYRLMLHKFTANFQNKMQNMIRLHNYRATPVTLVHHGSFTIASIYLNQWICGGQPAKWDNIVTSKSQCVLTSISLFVFVFRCKQAVGGAGRYWSEILYVESPGFCLKIFAIGSTKNGVINFESVSCIHV